MKPSRVNRRNMGSHPVLDGNALYEIDDACMKKKKRSQRTHPAPRKQR